MKNKKAEGVIKRMRRLLRNLALKWRMNDRYYFEKKLLPKIKNKKVLLVGLAPYCKEEKKILLKNKNELYTVDKNPDVAYLGNNHKVSNLKDVDFPNNFFDIVLVPFVYGYETFTVREQDLDEAEECFRNCYRMLKNEGTLIVGWNNRFNPTSLKGFKEFEEIDKIEIKNKMESTFNHLKKSQK